MRCPYCSKEDSKVIDTRESEEAIRRRRECLKCGHRFTTYERVAQTSLMVIKQKDSRREAFDRQKLISGIVRACAKRPVGMDAIEAMVDDIEAQLHMLGRSEVDSQRIGQMVMERLRTLDDVAYVRFASVYRRFADLESLQAEIQRLRERKEREQEQKAQLKLAM